MSAVDGGKPSAGAKTFVKLKPRTSAKSVLGKADRAQRARDRLPRSTAAGDDTLRNRIEPMHRAKKDAAEAVGEAAGVCRHNESQRWLDMRVGSPEDCCRDPPVVTQPPTSSATEESEGAPPLTAGLAAHRPTKHPLEHLYKYKYKGDLLQVVNAPGGSGKTLALATLLAEQEEIRSRSATWQLVEGLGSCDPPLSEDRRERAFVVLVYAITGQGACSLHLPF